MWYADSIRVDCGVDYYTATATDHPTSKLLLLKAEGLIFKEEQKGYFTHAWRMKGYSGWQVGRLQYGWREDGAIVRLSGSLAADEWWTLYQVTPRCSRIDLQVTLKLPISPSVAIFEMRSEALRFFEGSNAGPKITIWSDNRDGASLYLGCRQSDLYFRAYNKAAETKDDAFAGCVRLELEVKGGLCKSVIAGLLSSDTIQAGILGYICQYCENRGISTNLTAGVRRSFYERPAIATDELKSLAWFRQAVSPTVALLVERGRLIEVLDALGLSKMVPDCKSVCDTL